MPNNLDDAVETTTDGKRKVLCIYLTNPFFGSPERTLGDYRTEQQEARERHAMLQEQHRLLAKSLRWNIVLAAATLGIALATAALVAVTIYETPAERWQPPTKQVTPLEPPSSGHSKQ
jgi:hypothetical protein